MSSPPSPSLPPAALPAGALVGLGRIELTPGTQVALGATRQPVVLGIETGLLDLATAGGTAWTTGPDGQRWTLAEAVLGGGDVAVLDGGTSGTWRVAGDAPVAAFVLSFAPVGGGAKAPVVSASAVRRAGTPIRAVCCARFSDRVGSTVSGPRQTRRLAHSASRHIGAG